VGLARAEKGGRGEAPERSSRRNKLPLPNIQLENYGPAVLGKRRKKKPVGRKEKKTHTFSRKRKKKNRVGLNARQERGKKQIMAHIWKGKDVFCLGKIRTGLLRGEQVQRESQVSRCHLKTKRAVGGRSKGGEGETVGRSSEKKEKKNTRK